jgi:aminoglycoside phosphotransferase (APT) family kinase protein
VLSRLRPDIVLTPLAVDLDRGWMLLPDGGERLREVLARERNPDRWLEIVPRYAELQIAAAEHVDELLAAGSPDYRLDRLPGLAGEAASKLGVAAPPAGRIDDVRARLAAFGVPESIQHDDLHDGNVFVRPEGYAVFDWGDGCVSHPFASLLVALRGIAHRFELAEHDRDLERVRDAYLEPWAGFGPRSELLGAVELAGVMGRLSRALAWFRAYSEGGGHSDEAVESAGYWFREFSEALG